MKGGVLRIDRCWDNEGLHGRRGGAGGPAVAHPRRWYRGREWAQSRDGGEPARRLGVGPLLCGASGALQRDAYSLRARWRSGAAHLQPEQPWHRRDPGPGRADQPRRRESRPGRRADRQHPDEPGDHARHTALLHRRWPGPRHGPCRHVRPASGRGDAHYLWTEHRAPERDEVRRERRRAGGDADRLLPGERAGGARDRREEAGRRSRGHRRWHDGHCRLHRRQRLPHGSVARRRATTLRGTW